jgi:hypothetical protein
VVAPPQPGGAGRYRLNIACSETPFAIDLTNRSVRISLQDGDDIRCTFTLRDVTPPVVTVPANLELDATGPAGATVTYAASASDLADPSPALTCSPASGSIFPIGTAIVTCTATDAVGNSASRTFHVKVRGAGEQIARLIDKTLAFLDLPALRPVLRGRLAAAASFLAANNRPAACAALNAYKAVVQGAPASAFSPVEKAQLVADADRIRAVIGCK